MNDEARKFLTEWGGECWHEWNADENKCSCGVKGRMLANYSCDYENRTFDNWEDFGWLWGKMVESNTYLRFLKWYWGLEEMSVLEAWCIWECQFPKRRCRLICDFLRGQEGEG